MNRADKIAYLAGGVALLVPSSAPMWGGSPTVWAPMSLAVVVPAFLGLWFVGLFIPTIGFWIVGRRFLHGTKRLPRFVVIGFWILAVLNVRHLYGGWSYGVEWQGELHTRVVVVISAVSTVIIGGLVTWARRTESSRLSLGVTWICMLWLVWYGFPYLGELP